MIAMILIAIFTTAAFNQDDAPVCTRESAQTIQKEGIGGR